MIPFTSLVWQRLKPTDPVLSFRQCERQTFSMRPDREVTYCITVQTYSQGTQAVHTTGMQTQRFGLSGKHMRSNVCTSSHLVFFFYYQVSKFCVTLFTVFKVRVYAGIRSMFTLFQGLPSSACGVGYTITVSKVDGIPNSTSEIATKNIEFVKIVVFYYGIFALIYKILQHRLLKVIYLSSPKVPFS